ncbi:2-succinyl-6-hydroxy-2,4-cyclohexadiene-1-carboxylate synthase [Aciduricibacillus chroicocephali]|uniref:Putative 2-succinyl-6-hydroxy-2,4-cyclohexadiene-1-carboxylate synthase n=1 Tax=Aciduricibacillus chroicocephali TaxID=3054939 RepID=A0ABY9KSQ8_9BACI|nr:2-succinyl-6-hydroxy-2,4-cyclohexadiene-1-carboxylate synthase [Bacillaceae bacterium 44XB]
MRFSGKYADYEYYDNKGKGLPIVLFHGFTGTSGTWEHFINSAIDRRVITIDLPGHGKTVSKSAVTMEQFSDDLQSLLYEQGIDLYHLVGYSMGGRTALFHTCAHPESIQSLTLESSSPGIAVEKERAARIASDEQLAERILTRGVKAFVDDWENIPLFKSQKMLSEKIRETIRNERLNQTKEGLAASLRGMGTGTQRSLWEELNKLPMPVLLLAGELDEKFVHIAQQMEKRLLNSKMIIIPDVGHAIHVENPSKFDKVVLEFVTACT